MSEIHDQKQLAVLAVWADDETPLGRAIRWLLSSNAALEAENKRLNTRIELLLIEGAAALIRVDEGAAREAALEAENKALRSSLAAAAAAESIAVEQHNLADSECKALSLLLAQKDEALDLAYETIPAHAGGPLAFIKTARRAPHPSVEHAKMLLTVVESAEALSKDWSNIGKELALAEALSRLGGKPWSRSL